MKKVFLLGSMIFVFFAYFASFAGTTNAGDATITLDDNAGSSSFVVQDVDKTNQFKVNSDGQGYFAGNVGIGASAPNTLLHISEYKGSAWSDSGCNLLVENTASGNNAILRLKSSGGGSDYAGINFTGSGLQFVSGTGPSDTFVMMMTNAGNVGIGTTAPSEKLEVSGNIKASGTVSQGSSKEFKKNIAYVSTKDAMKALNKLNPVRFEYKTDNSGEKHLGFIAENVPDLVAEQDRRHLNAMDITAVLTKVVQEQQRQIQEQQKVISTLLNEVREIKGKI